MTHFEHALWSVKHCVYKFVWHYFLYQSENSEVYFFFNVYETVSYLWWIRNPRSTVDVVLLEAFYNKLDEVEKSFLGNWFIDEHYIDDYYELDSESDNREAENEADVTEVEKEIEQIEEEEGVDMKHNAREKTLNESKNSATI